MAWLKPGARWYEWLWVIPLLGLLLAYTLAGVIVDLLSGWAWVEMAREEERQQATR